MGERSQLTEEDRIAIGEQAQRLAAFVQLKRLVERWRVELDLQAKADRAVARACGAVLAIAMVSIWAMLFWHFHQLLVSPLVSPIHAVRLAFWYPAAVVASFPLFFAGCSYAIYTVLPSFEKLVIYALPVAAVLFLVGLLLAPLTVWLSAS